MRWLDYVIEIVSICIYPLWSSVRRELLFLCKTLYEVIRQSNNIVVPSHMNLDTISDGVYIRHVIWQRGSHV